MSEYIITIKQLATVIAKCHGLMPENADGTPICNPREIAELIDEPITLKEIVRCRDCKHYKDRNGAILPGTVCQRLGYYNFKVEPDGFCKWASRRES